MSGMHLDKHIAKFKTEGWTSMANFAFAVEFQPGVGPSKDALHDAIFKKLLPSLGPDECNAEVIVVRRLCWECYSGAAGPTFRGA